MPKHTDRRVFIEKVRDVKHARRILSMYGRCIRPVRDGHHSFECCLRGEAYETADIYTTMNLTTIVKDQIRRARRAGR